MTFFLRVMSHQTTLQWVDFQTHLFDLDTQAFHRSSYVKNILGKDKSIIGKGKDIVKVLNLFICEAWILLFNGSFHDMLGSLEDVILNSIKDVTAKS